MLVGDYANSQDLESQRDLSKIPRIAEAILGMEVFHARAEKLREETCTEENKALKRELISGRR